MAVRRREGSPRREAHMAAQREAARTVAPPEGRSNRAGRMAAPPGVRRVRMAARLEVRSKAEALAVRRGREGLNARTRVGKAERRVPEAAGQREAAGQS